MTGIHSSFIKFKPIVLLLMAFAILGTIYSCATPLFEGPDETGHYSYIATIVNAKKLPIQSADPAQQTTYEAHQPPLYYGLSALLTFWIDLSNEPLVLRLNPQFVWSGHGTEPNAVWHTAAEQFPWLGVALLMHIARLVSVVLGCVTVWGTYRLGKLVTKREVMALGAAALVAFNPQFLFISSVVNNDNGLIACSTLALVMMVELLINGYTRSRLIWLGLWIGLAILSKSSGLVLLLLALYPIGIVAIRQHNWRLLVVMLGWLALPVVVISGWWFARNQLLYGDLLGYQMFLAINGSLAPSDFSRWETWRSFFELMHRSFWGQFGWMVIRLKRWMYDLLAGLYGLALAGALLSVVLSLRARGSLRQQLNLSWIFLIGIVLGWLLWTIYYSSVQGGSGYQGRYVFPAIAAISNLIAAGVSAPIPKRFKWVPLGAMVVPLAILTVSVPQQSIARAYHYWTVPDSVLNSVAQQLSGTFSAEIALAGYRMQSSTDTIDLTLYWRAQGTPQIDYKVFVHVFNTAGQFCGQQDELTQKGAFPMWLWKLGDVIEDHHVIPFDALCRGETGYHLNVGLYREDTGERLLYSINGQPVSDHVEIQP